MVISYENRMKNFFSDFKQHHSSENEIIKIS